MAKAKQPAVVSDTTLEILVFPQRFKLRCDHAGAELPEDQDPDVHTQPESEGEPPTISTRPDGPHLVRARYAKKCDRFGKTDTVELAAVDDPARVCPGCGFNRTIVEVA